MKFGLVALVVILIPCQDFDKSKHNWLRFKPGTFVKIKIAMERGGQKQEATMRQELADIKDKEFCLKVVFEMGGESQEQLETHTFPVKDGEETLTVDGKEYKCTIWKVTQSRAGQTMNNRVWMADGINVPIKMITKGQAEDTEFLASKLHDEVSAAGQKFDCVRLDGTNKAAQGEQKGSLWFSSDVPGGLVKLESSGEAKVTLELLEFTIK
jgi:hypothetical protein